MNFFNIFGFSGAPGSSPSTFSILILSTSMGKIAKKTILTGIQALKKLYSSINYNSNFSKAVNLLSKMKGKCLVVGVGKSYIVSLKVSATLSSLGTPSVAFSANDLQHGGLGFLSKDDTLLIFSVSGESSELNSILRYAKRFNLKVIGVSCKPSSMLLKHSTIKILLPKVSEAGFSLAPTSSTTMFCCFGDALGIALMKRKKFTNKKFVTTHPSGTLATALVHVLAPSSARASAFDSACFSHCFSACLTGCPRISGTIRQ